LLSARNEEVGDRLRDKVGEPLTDEVFYKAPGGKVLNRLARKARLGIFDVFVDRIRPAETDTILDVGVSVVEDNPEESNILEQMHPYSHRVTMLGIHDGSFLEKRFPGTRYRRYDPRGNFPFSDGEFDVCYCNAVLEHVGLAEDRRRFLREVLRVGRKVFLTTPNRWFPLEMHKRIPFLHWLPQAWYRAILRTTGDNFYSRPENLNLLSRNELDRLFRELDVPFTILPYRFMGFISNWVVVAK
jgi:hypothetical protein